MSDESEKRVCSTCKATVYFGVKVVGPSESGELYHFGACIPSHVRERFDDTEFHTEEKSA